MRHGKNRFKVGRTGSHRRAMMANMLKSLIEHGRVKTTLVKAKELRRHADRMITLAKGNNLAARRAVIAELKIVYNTLTPKEARDVKKGDTSAYNRDRQIINKLFGELRERYTARTGGYTRLIPAGDRVGDNARTAYLEYLV